MRREWGAPGKGAERAFVLNRGSSLEKKSPRCSEELAQPPQEFGNVLGVSVSQGHRSVIQRGHSGDEFRRWCHLHHTEKITQAKGSGNTDGKEGKAAAVLKSNRWDLATDSIQAEWEGKEGDAETAMPFINRVCRRKKCLRADAIGSCLDVLNVRSLKNTVVSPLETEPGAQSKGLSCSWRFRHHHRREGS